MKTGKGNDGKIRSNVFWFKVGSRSAAYCGTVDLGSVNYTDSTANTLLALLERQDAILFDAIRYRSYMKTIANREIIRVNQEPEQWDLAGYERDTNWIREVPLSGKERGMVQMYLDGHTQEEIASRFGITQSCVNKKFRKMKSSFKHYFHGNYSEISTDIQGLGSAIAELKNQIRHKPKASDIVTPIRMIRKNPGRYQIESEKAMMKHAAVCGHGPCCSLYPSSPITRPDLSKDTIPVGQTYQGQRKGYRKANWQIMEESAEIRKRNAANMKAVIRHYEQSSVGDWHK